MTTQPLERLGLVYSSEFFTEPPLRTDRAGNSGPTGQEVACSRFLGAYLRFGEIGTLVPLITQRSSIQALEHLARAQGGSKVDKTWQFVPAPQFHQHFIPNPAARVIHSPVLPNPAHLWTRAGQAPHAFALSGIVHGLGQPAQLRELLTLATAPLHPYDTLICPHQAMRNAVQMWLASARETVGLPGEGPRLAVVPWGVDPERYRPADAASRSTARQSLGVPPGETVVLSVGRLSVHGRSNPFPLFHGLYHAARQTGRKVRLLLVGWAANETMRKAILDGARVFAPTIAVTHREGEIAEVQQAYAAADLFVDFADSVIQAHGLSLLEAMACGLPAVCTDWGGHRDLVQPDETGMLIPTQLLTQAAAPELTRGLQGEINEETFLGQTSQTVLVDLEACVRALSGVLTQPERLRRMGEAARRRVEQQFTWQHTVAAYDRLWQEQESLRNEYAGRSESSSAHGLPRVETLFRGYATKPTDDSCRVQTVLDRLPHLPRMSKVAMTSFAGDARCGDLATLTAVLETARQPVSLSELQSVLERAGSPKSAATATLAWLLKYGLLTRVEADG